MEPFSACVALGPLAIYLLLVGMINLSPRPLVVSGTRETLALGLALAGLVIVGPMQLFLPREAAAQFGWGVWLLLSAFYVLCVLLATMLARPRLVVYNVALDDLPRELIATAERLDHDSRWIGGATFDAANAQSICTSKASRPCAMRRSYPRATIRASAAGVVWRLPCAYRCARCPPPARRTASGWFCLDS